MNAVSELPRGGLSFSFWEDTVRLLRPGFCAVL